jgi:hypothetical protein
MRDGALVLHFIADHYNYNFAQSGSDWADHYVFVGEAHLVGGKRKRETFELERHVHLTEHEDAGYDPRKILAAVRSEVRARFRGETPSRDAFERAVADVRASSDALCGRSTPKGCGRSAGSACPGRACVLLPEVPLRSGRLQSALRRLSAEMRDLRPLAGFRDLPGAGKRRQLAGLR